MDYQQFPLRTAETALHFLFPLHPPYLSPITSFQREPLMDYNRRKIEGQCVFCLGCVV
jgi:hypothetical protein